MPAISLGQACAHCLRFSTAASQRSRALVAVPMWRFRLSAPLRILGLVSPSLTNNLLLAQPIKRQAAPSRRPPFGLTASWRIRTQRALRLHRLVGSALVLTRSPRKILREDPSVRLACLRRIASTQGGPEPNPCCLCTRNQVRHTKSLVSPSPRHARRRTGTSTRPNTKEVFSCRRASPVTADPLPQRSRFPAL